jgi:antitoxin (DNA-binding transcriptional repressor) of toxin-antitoxin stability system
MELSADQVQAIESGEAVTITVDQTPCVLIRADIYERIRQMLDMEAAYPLIDETFQEGWEAPGMSDYDRYDELKRQ